MTKKEKKKSSLFKRLLGDLASVVLTLAIVCMGLYVLLQSQVPDVKSLADVHLQVPMRVYSRDGLLIAQFGDKRRTPVQFEMIPPLLINAILATEDARFYEHSGVDLIGLVRAAVVMIKSGRKAQGASTITMQVARNFYLTRKKTFHRKLIEIMLAMKIDSTFSKNMILSLYLNKIYFGNHAYGVAAAAEVYYGLPLDQLTLAQQAMIAGLPQSPSRNNPIRRPKAALTRRNHVLYRMSELHLIDQAAYEKATQEPVTAKYHRQRIGLYAPYVAETVRQALLSRYGDQAYEKGIAAYTTIDSQQQQAAEKALRKGLIQYSRRHGYPGPTAQLPLESYNHWVDSLATYSNVSGFSLGVVTALADQSASVLLKTGDVVTIPWSGLAWARPMLSEGKRGKAPKKASDVLSVGDVIRLQQKGKVDHQIWSLSAIPAVQGALVSLDPDSGDIRALSGGFDFQLSVFNRALQAERQPGSSFKPFIYSAALHHGLTLASMINDAPVVLKDSGENRYWRPENDTRRFYGPTTLQVGLTHSRNLVSIRLLQRIGIEPTIQYATRFGLQADKLPHSLSLALGSGLVTPVQLAQGYGVFANGGFFVPAHLLSRVDMNGKVNWQYQIPRVGPSCWPTEDANSSDAASIPVVEVTNPEAAPDTAPQTCSQAAITPQNAYLMTQALQDVIQHGTGRAARVLKRHDLSGKTGTTNKQLDAWFAGFDRHLVTVVWVGFDNMQSLNEYGSQVALPIWIDYMRTALAGTPDAVLPQPPGIVAVRINQHTGQIDNSNHAKTRLTYFRSENAPSSEESHSDDAEASVVSTNTVKQMQPVKKAAKDTSEEDIF